MDRVHGSSPESGSWQPHSARERIAIHPHGIYSAWNPEHSALKDTGLETMKAVTSFVSPAGPAPSGDKFGAVVMSVCLRHHCQFHGGNGRYPILPGFLRFSLLI
jgi:hypothetical protein